MIIAKYFSFDVRWQGHGVILSGQINVKDDVSDGAGNQDARIGFVTDHKNGSARVVAHFLQATSNGLAVNHPGREVGNRDASLSFDAHGKGAAGQHDLNDQIGSPDSVDLRIAGIECAQALHSRLNNSAGRGHNDCRSIPLCGNGRKDNVGRAVPSAIKSRRRLDRIR